MSAMPEVPAAAWEKSSYSNGSGGQCIEFCRSFAIKDAVPVRDSKDPQGPALVFSADAWSAFVAGIRVGDFPIT